MKASFLFISFIFFSLFLHGQDVFVLKNSSKYYNINGQVLEVFEDTANTFSGNMDLESIPFKKTDAFYFSTENPGSTYWARLILIDSSDFSHRWFFVSYNYSMDSLDMFAYHKNEKIFSEQYRLLTTKLSDKDVAHKNLTLDFPIPKNEPVTVYLKVKNKNPGQYGFALREHKEFFSASIFEYFFFGIFYGGLLMISLYHLSFFFSLRDFSYLFYSFYIVIQGIYMCYRDATALVFVFPNAPYLVESTYPVVMFLLAVSVLLYARFFLELNSYRIFNRLIIAFVILRFPFLFIISNYTVGLQWFDLSAILLAFIFSILSLIQKHRTAALFTVSFGVIILGYLINVLWHANIIPGTQVIFYSLYFAVAIESLLLALANAYRLRKLKEASMLKNVFEEKVNEGKLKIKHQEELIREKSNDLDMLLYRASHDIKGPLKSIEGLCQVGQLDEKEKNTYFQRISASSKRLQNILNSLLDIARQNRAEMKVEKVLIYQLVHECIYEHLREYPGFNELEFIIKVPENASIISDKYSLLSIVQNIAENAIKYRDVEKEKSFLSVTLQQTSQYNTLIFEDNGVGVNENYLSKMFQMFYRANSDLPDGAGLGLYIVKQNVERLGGKISFTSREKEFTRIEVKFPVNINDL
jgi:signal transduction histidine kinase